MFIDDMNLLRNKCPKFVTYSQNEKSDGLTGVCLASRN